MHLRHLRERARSLLVRGLSDCAVGRELGLPRETVRYWRRGGAAIVQGSGCPVCDPAVQVPPEYAYLLGLYLGDGHIALHRRGVYRLRLTLDSRYTEIIREATSALAEVSRGRKVCRQERPGCVVVSAYWKHWPCVFPQHGPGVKHTRPIELRPFQEDILQASPGTLLRGLIHSDGCRVLNRVGAKEYPRYHFSNRSGDIKKIFCRACDAMAVRWTRSSAKEISVARARDVARLDAVVGPKR